MWGDSAFRRAMQLVESQKGLIRDLVKKQHSLSDELQGMCVLVTGMTAELAAADVVRKRLQERVTAGERREEDLRYHLQLANDELKRLQKAQATDSAQELLLTGLHDLNVRVGKLEAMQWQKGEGQ